MSDAPVNVGKKRFIAGAVCPACRALDTIRLWDADGTATREGGACGFGDTLDAQGNAIPREIPTRVNKSASKPANPKVQAVQFFPNPKLKKHD